MGYYSEVAIEMYAREKDDAPVMHLWFDSQDVPEWAKESFKKHDYGVSFYSEGIKWNYAEEIQKVLSNYETAFIDNEDVEGLYDFEFVRIGEEMDDIEYTSSSGLEYLDITRKIERVQR